MPRQRRLVSAMARRQGNHNGYSRAIKNALDKIDLNQSVNEISKQVTDIQNLAKKGMMNGTPKKGMIEDKLAVVKERSSALNKKMREYFNDNESKIIKEWENQTGITWPKQANGKRATPHHVIPIKNGGSNEWWNIIPVQHPHTGTIHGQGSALRTHMPYQKTGGKLWYL
ncbi:HNH endonuclease [Photorhabdus akhurstii]|uniref:HNH endonuclease n=1 Tax=Photorhabdus akhurstii TaxID=171438 RepID=UPI0015E299CA